MKFLLDTCVISEVVRPQPNKAVLSWLQDQDESDLYLSVLTLGEIEKGIEKALDQIRKARLRLWLENDLSKRFENRIIPIDTHIAARWGRVQGAAEKAGTPMPVIDGLIAVSGLVNACTVVTRNISDMKPSFVELFNPWL